MPKRMIVLVLVSAAAGLRAQQSDHPAATDPATMHAQALAELGRHGDAVKALEAMQGSDGSTALVQEHRLYEFSVQHTQACTTDTPCMAEDLLAVGRLQEAMAAQKEQIKEIQQKQRANQRTGDERSGGNMTVRLANETDSTAGKLIPLADAYDLQARIEAAMGHTGQALKSLEAAEKALPEGEKTIPRAAGYAYHRALILAEDHKYAAAAKACSASLSLDASSTVLGPQREQECQAITVLASEH